VQTQTNVRKVRQSDQDSSAGSRTQAPSQWILGFFWCAQKTPDL